MCQLISTRSLGLEIDGGATEEKPAKEGKAKPMYQGYRSPIDWEIKDAVCTPQLWLVGIAWGSVVFGYCAVQYFGMTHLIMNGFSEMSASSAVSIMSGSILVTSLLLSPLTDRMNPKVALVGIGIVTSVGCVLFDVSANLGSMPLMVVSMILVGANGPIICAVMNTLVSYYGAKNYAGIQPYCNVLLTLIGAASSLVCGWALDSFGSLSNAFYVAAAFGIGMSVIVLLFMKPPKVTETMLAKYQAKTSV